MSGIGSNFRHFSLGDVECFRTPLLWAESSVLLRMTKASNGLTRSKTENAGSSRSPRACQRALSSGAQGECPRHAAPPRFHGVWPPAFRAETDDVQRGRVGVVHSTFRAVDRRRRYGAPDCEHF